VTEEILDTRGRGLSRYWRAGAAVEYQILERLRANVGGYYDRNRDELHSEWQTWTGNCGLVWEFLRWYSLSLDYTYVDRNDDVELAGYTDNQVMLMLNASRLFRW
jgi:uncharacterized protein (PEP-CTERM system associated)